MSVRTKKLVGMLLLSVALTIYAFAGLYVAVEFLPDQWLVQLVYYAAIGTLWAFPARRLLSWIYRGAAPDA